MSQTEATVQNEDSATAAVITFLKDEHELTKLAKALDKASKKAVEFLQSVLEDPAADSLRRQQAAEKILTFVLQANKQINDDNMARLIAQAKLGGAKSQPIPLGEGGKPTNALPGPRLDFDTVRQV